MSQTVVKFQPGFLKPRYWPVWLVLGLLRLIALLPYPAMLWLGKRVGRLAHKRAGRFQKLTRYNLIQCFPDKPMEERREWERGHFESLGISLFELALCWWGRDKSLRRLVKIEGLNKLEAALADGKGALLLCSHVTTLEMGARLLGLFTQFRAMYRPMGNPVLEWVVCRNREKYIERIFPPDDARQLLRSLKQNWVMWYAPDLALLDKNHVMAPFFGIPAPTNPAVSRIARASGTAVLPFYIQRLPGKQGYRLIIDEPLKDFPGNNVLDDATRINRIIEKQVLQAPEQYLWRINRFKWRDYEDLDMNR